MFRYSDNCRCLPGVSGPTEDALAIVSAEDVKALGHLMNVRHEIRDGVDVVLCSESCGRVSFTLVNGKKPGEYRLQRPPTWSRKQLPEGYEAYVDSFMIYVNQVRGQ